MSSPRQKSGISPSDPVYILHQQTPKRIQLFQAGLQAIQVLGSQDLPARGTPILALLAIPAIALGPPALDIPVKVRIGISKQIGAVLQIRSFPLQDRHQVILRYCSKLKRCSFIPYIRLKMTEERDQWLECFAAPLPRTPTNI